MLKAEWDQTNEAQFPYSLQVEFDGGDKEELADQLAWIESRLNEAGLSDATVPYRRRGFLCMQLRFAAFADYARFHLTACGDTKHISTKCIIDFPSEVSRIWMTAAKAFCDAGELKPEVQQSDKQAVFKFEYLSDLAGFRIAVENGEIDRLADSLHRLERLQGRRPAPVPKPSVGPYHPLNR